MTRLWRVSSFPEENVDKADKQKVVDELTERLRSAESLIVADYRGLTNGQLASLRTELLKHGARLTVVKNTLTRRAAEAAGADALLAILEGPTAIAFVEAAGDPVGVAKAFSDAARETKILALRGGVLSGKTITGGEIETLAKLPPFDVLRAQLVGVIVAPLTQLVAVLNAPLQNLVGLIDARIDQLGGADVADTPAAGEETADEPVAAAVVEDATQDEEAVTEDEEAVTPEAEAATQDEEAATPEAEAATPQEEAPSPKPAAESEVDEPAAEASEDTEPEKNEEE
jgi:large subunit ribosomal protein L10